MKTIFQSIAIVFLTIFLSIVSVGVLYAQTCFAENSTLLFTSDLSYSNLSPITFSLNASGDEITSFSGSVSVSGDLSKLLPYSNLGACASSGSTVLHDYTNYTFRVATAGAYTFTKSSGTLTNAVLHINSGLFDGCTNWVGSSAISCGPAGGICNASSLTVSLVPNTVYTLRVSGLTSSNTGSYTITHTGGTIYKATTTSNSYSSFADHWTLVYDVNTNKITDISVCSITPFSGSVGGGTTAALPLGQYKIYGLSSLKYTSGSNTLLRSYIGSDFSAFQALLNAGTVCGKLSSNSRNLTIVCPSVAAPSSVSVSTNGGTAAASVCTSPNVVLTSSAVCAASSTPVWFLANGTQINTMPALTPAATTSYYAKCANSSGCLSPASNTVTVFINATATIRTTTPQPACLGSMVTLQSNCATNSTSNGTIWRSSTGVEVSSNANEYQVEASDLSYTAQCFTALCGNSDISKPIQLQSKRFDVQFLNVETSTANTKVGATSSGSWSSPINSGNYLSNSTAESPTIYSVESNPAPRYWTAELQICDAKLTPKSVIWDLYRYNEVTGKQEQTFYSIENGAPWFMFANIGYSKLYTLDHPVYGFGASYAGGFPRGKYILTLYLKDAQGLEYGSVPSPTTRTAQGNTLSTLKYYFNITSTVGPGMGAARMANLSSNKSEVELATAYPNPTKSKLNVIINNSKGQDVLLNLIDIMGRSLISKNVVPTSDVYTEEIDINNANTGIYFIKIQTPTKSKTIKINKE